MVFRTRDVVHEAGGMVHRAVLFYSLENTLENSFVDHSFSLYFEDSPGDHASSLVDHTSSHGDG